MKRRNFIKTMGMSVFISKLFISCSESPISSVSELEDKKQEYLIIEKDKITIYKPLTDIDKSVLENFLMQFDKNEDPNYSLEDLEKNLLLIKNHDKEFTGTLIDENGYFITVKHSLKSNLKDYQAITSSNQIYNIEKIIISSEFCDYDFVLGKINNETPLEFSNMLYSTKINIGDSVTYVPSPIHSSRTKVTGEIIKKKNTIEHQFNTNASVENGHSGSLVVKKNKVIGLHQMQFFRVDNESKLIRDYSADLKTEYIKEIVKLVL